MQSEYYQLRRTTIKDVAAYCGFLIGFLGSAPFAWRYLSAQLESDQFVRGLWYFFGIVGAAAVFSGAAGLGAGFMIGWLWERVHRARRSRRLVTRIGQPENIAADNPAGPAAAEAPRLQLVPPSDVIFPDLARQRLSSVRFGSRSLEFVFGRLVIEVTGNPVVSGSAGRFRYPQAGSRDALCGLIGDTVGRMNVSRSEAEILFDSGSELLISRDELAIRQGGAG